METLFRGAESCNSQGRLIALEDRNSNAITIERNSVDRIIRIIEPAGCALTVGYDSQGHVASITEWGQEWGQNGVRMGSGLANWLMRVEA